MKNIQIQINLGLIALAIGLVFGGLVLVDAWEAAMVKGRQVEVVQGCMEVAKRTWVDGEKSGEEMDMVTYEKCVEESK